jgi:Ion channel
VQEEQMNILERLARNDEETGGVGRHTILLCSLLLLLLLLPVFRLVPGGGSRFSLLLIVVLCAAIYVNSTERWTLVAGVLMGGGAIVSVGIAQATGSHAAVLLADCLSLALLSVTTLFILNTLMQANKISGDTIVGGICVYMLIGLSFAMAYILITDLYPGTFIDRGQPLSRSVANPGEASASILYFSFVTLTTLGFGDIIPTGEVARMLATSEAIIGQLFIAIFIARLVARR